MANMSSEDFISRIESIRQAPLDSNEVLEIQMWQDGKALSQLVAFPGWEVIISMLQGYAEAEVQRCMKTDPKNKEEVAASHAVAFALNGVFLRFLEDVNNRIEASKTTPDVIKQQIRKPADVPFEQ
jgi:hypothetical protein